jgi:hypothetical protein
MVGEPQGAMRGASQIWQVVFALQTLPDFCLALRKKAQYVVVKPSGLKAQQEGEKKSV